MPAAKKTTKASPAKSTPGSGLDQVVGQIQQKHGEGSIMRLGQETRARVETVKSGSLSLDLAIGGGYPLGRVIEIFGPESSGKTTLGLHAICEFQKAGKTAAFIDAEHALDPAYAAKIGVDADKLLLSQPDNGDQALDIVEQLAGSGSVDLIIIDSVAALTPKAEIDGTISDQQVGLQARMMSKAMRRLTGPVSRQNCSLIFINQLRMKIGVMFGNPETTPGGNALKFYASMRLDIRRLGQIKQAEASLGNRVKVRVVKNKVAPPFRVAEFDIMFNEGISQAGDILDLAVERGLVSKSGAWFSYNDQQIAQGREAAKDYLKQNPKIMDELEKQIRAAV